VEDEDLEDQLLELKKLSKKHSQMFKLIATQLTAIHQKLKFHG